MHFDCKPRLLGSNTLELFALCFSHQKVYSQIVIVRYLEVYLKEKMMLCTLNILKMVLVGIRTFVSCLVKILRITVYSVP